MHFITWIWVNLYRQVYVVLCANCVRRLKVSYIYDILVKNALKQDHYLWNLGVIKMGAFKYLRSCEIHIMGRRSDDTSRE